MELAGELEHARIPRARNGAKRRSPETPARVIERWCVRHVEDLRTQLEPCTFGDPECLAQHQVCLLEPGPADRISRAVPDRELWSLHEGARVEPLRSAPVRQTVWVCDSVRALHGIAETRIEISRLRDCNRIAALNADEASYLPTRELPKPWYPPDPTGRKHSWDIAARKIAFEAPVESIGCTRIVQDGSGEDTL